MIVNPSIQGALRDLADNNVWSLVDSGAPINGTTGTGAGYAGISSTYYDKTGGRIYSNRGTKANPTWILLLIGSGSGDVTGTDLVESLLRQTETSITNAQVLALRATPITLVNAPGAGKVIEFLSAVLLFDRTAAYTETADNLSIKFNNGTGTKASVDIETTGFVDAAADAIYFAEPVAGTILGVKTLFENLPLVLHNDGDGEFGGGNAANVLRVKTTYRVWATRF